MNTQLEDLVNSSLFKAEQLIVTKGINIFTDPVVLAKIQENFKPNQKMSIYVAAGKVGTGKSSHQTAMVKRLSDNLLDESAPFDVILTTNTYTQGVWVYPYPLYSQSHPDVQILVVDLEGMDGLKDQNIEDTMMNLLKIYLFGMLISSVFTVHVESKIDATTIEILKKAFEICRTLKSTLKVESPKTYLLLKDIDSVRYAKAIQETRELIEKHFLQQQYQQESRQLIIEGRGSPPESFRYSLAKDCGQLDGTAYLAVIDELITTIRQNPKMDPSLINTSMRLQDFVTLVETVCKILNEKDFEKNLIASIDYIKLEKLNEIYTSHLEVCVNESIKTAQNAPLTLSIEDFKAQVNEYAEKCITEFGQQVFQRVNLSVTIENWTEKHKAVFRATTRSMGAVEIFVRRKIEAEENEKLRKEHESKLEEQMEFTEKARKCAETLQNQIIEMDQKHKEEMAKNQQEHDEQLRKLAQETMEKIRKLEEEGAENAEEHKRKFDEMQNKYQKDLKKYEDDLLQRKAEIEKIENNRKADNDFHKQEIQKLQQEYKAQLETVGQEAEAKRREIEARIHERELAWTNQKHEQDLKHMREMQQIQSQLSEVRAAKNKEKSGGLFSFLTSIVTKPLQELAMGVVKTFKF